MVLKAQLYRIAGLFKTANFLPKYFVQAKNAKKNYAAADGDSMPPTYEQSKNRQMNLNVSTKINSIKW